MRLEYIKITPERADDFLDFFDRLAFTPDDEWAGCYCLEGHLKGEDKIKSPLKRRCKAEKLVKSGKLTGYLIKDGDRLIGWVKLGDKLDFDGFIECPHGEMPKKHGVTASIYCIDLINEYRGRGLSREILEFAVRASSEAGFEYLEGYPSSDLYEKRNYRGHMGIYIDAGFESIEDFGEFIVMRKKL